MIAEKLAAKDCYESPGASRSQPKIHDYFDKKRRRR